MLWVPVWGDGDEDNKLEAAVTGSLRLADELKCASIALPAISTGIYGFPKDRAAGIIFSAIEKYFADHSSSGLKTVKLVLYDQPTVDVFLKSWQDKWGRTTVITSSQNPKIKLVRALLGRAKERREAGAFVVEGVRLVEEAETRDWRFSIRTL